MYELLGFMTLIAISLGLISLCGFIDWRYYEVPFVSEVCTVVGLASASGFGALIGVGLNVVIVGRRNVLAGAALGCLTIWLLFIGFAIAIRFAEN